MDLETIVVVPSSCYRNGNLEDLGEERAVRTLPTRKDSFTRVVLALYHVAKYLPLGYDRLVPQGQGRKPRALFPGPVRRKGSMGRAAEEQLGS